MSSVIDAEPAWHIPSLPRKRGAIFAVYPEPMCSSLGGMTVFVAGEMTGAVGMGSTENPMDTHWDQHQAAAQNLILCLQRVEVPSLPAWDCMCSRRLL